MSVKVSYNKDGKRTFQEYFKTLKLKKVTHAKLKKIAKKNYRTMSGQIQIWVDNEK